MSFRARAERVRFAGAMEELFNSVKPHENFSPEEEKVVRKVQWAMHKVRGRYGGHWRLNEEAVTVDGPKYCLEWSKDVMADCWVHKHQISFTLSPDVFQLDTEKQAKRLWSAIQSAAGSLVEQVYQADLKAFWVEWHKRRTPAQLVAIDVWLAKHDEFPELPWGYIAEPYRARGGWIPGKAITLAPGMADEWDAFPRE
jgi:hypothetical protein